MTEHLITLLDTARRIADTDLYPVRCRSVITDLANALQAASTELTESREYALALEQELADRSKTQAKFTAMAASNINALTEALAELHAIVVGECPSLLNEDSGGNGELSCRINDILNEQMPMKTGAREAANILLEHIVYSDLAERRGTEIADAVITELAEIGVKSDSALIEGKPL